jgi:spore maturation protein CgeB
VHFYERDVPWYASNRDMPRPPFGTTRLYDSVGELASDDTFLRDADVVLVGSYVPDSIELTRWLRTVVDTPLAFYDIDTPVTVAQLERNQCAYLTRETIGWYDLYLSFAGGPVLDRLHREFGAALVRPLYCSVDPALYFPEIADTQYELGYLGTYSIDRQPSVERLLLDVARREPGRRFAVAGAQYPREVHWPANVRHFEHLPPSEHRSFYNAQRFTLNVTRADMIANGYSPSVRLFEAAACGVPIISDWWPGLDEFFEPESEILLAQSTEDVQRALQCDDHTRAETGRRARDRVLAAHTSAHRAQELERYVSAVAGAEVQQT